MTPPEFGSSTKFCPVGLDQEVEELSCDNCCIKPEKDVVSTKTDKALLLVVVLDDDEGAVAEIL